VFGTSYTDISGSVLIADLINISRPLEKLNRVGLAELILTEGWYIWWERMKIVHGESIQHPVRSAVSIATLATNYLIGQCKRLLGNGRGGRSRLKGSY
jgi:hypothetical protein